MAQQWKAASALATKAKGSNQKEKQKQHIGSDCHQESVLEEDDSIAAYIYMKTKQSSAINDNHSKQGTVDMASTVGWSKQASLTGKKNNN